MAREFGTWKMGKYYYLKIHVNDECIATIFQFDDHGLATNKLGSNRGG